MTIAQGINKIVSIKAQTALGTPAIGAGGQTLRRKTSVASKKRATYMNDEINSTQQSYGVNLGTATSAWAFDGLLSPLTYQLPIAMLLRRLFTTGVASAAASITVGVAGQAYTLTRSAGNFLTESFKIGDVVQNTAGAFTNGVNLNNNFLIVGLTATVITFITLNGTLPVAEGPIAAAVVTVIGKKTMAAATAQTDTLFTIEEWYPEINQSELFPDMRMGQLDIGLPASGNATVKMAAQGLGVRTPAVTQQMTSPAAATTTNVLTAVRGALVVNGVQSVTVTGITITMKATLTAEGPIVGSNFSPDMSRGLVEVSGQFTGLFDTPTLRNLFDSETVTSLVCAMAADTTNNSNFMAFSLSAIKLTAADADDGLKGIVRTYPFTASINLGGGPLLANDQTIISVQDSQAV
jgi:hypothetical protein